MDEECIAEPVFNGRLCVYQTNREATQSIFLIHGIGDNASRDWQHQLAVLAERFHIVTFDLPGFGNSERGDRQYSPEKYSALIDFVATHYAVQQFDLVGHSMGGAVAMLYASAFPTKVQRLVVVDAAGVLHRLAIGKYVIAGGINGDTGGTDRVQSYVVKIIEKLEGLFSFFRDDMAEQSAHARAGIELVAYDFGPALDEINVPTLIIWGAEDQIAPLRTAKVLHYRIRNSQLRVIDGAGHLPMMDKSEEFNPILMDFLLSAEEPGAVENSETAAPGNTGSCNGEQGVRFSGVYERLEINNCSDVIVTAAHIAELYVFESRVVIEDSRIGGDVAVALESIGSDIKMTTSRVDGEVGIKVARSRFDLAAVDIFSKEQDVLALSKSRIICSVCRSFRVAGKRSVHAHVTLGPGDTL